MEGQVVMFCGKGGVGKTTCAAATALAFADAGKKTLVVSTDPTPSLRHIFGVKSGSKVVEVTENLYLREIGFDEVKELWEARFGPEIYAVFSAFVDIDYREFVDFVASILPGVRDEFMVDCVRLLSQSEYEAVVWDTAPAGQTLGLLQIPSIVNRHLKPAPKIYMALKAAEDEQRSILEVIKGWEALSVENMSFLRTKVVLNLVTIPEALAVRQLDNLFQEFGSYGLGISRIIINQVILNPDSPFLARRAAVQERYIQEIAEYRKPYQLLPLLSDEVRGVEELRKVARLLSSS